MSLDDNEEGEGEILGPQDGDLELNGDPEEIAEIEPARRRGRPRRVTVPADKPDVTVSFERPSNGTRKAKLPKLSPFKAAQKAQVESWETEYAKLAEDMTWSVKRTGPPSWRGRPVQTGVFGGTMSGPAKAQTISPVLGGGTFFVKLDQPGADWVGPINVLGAPKFDLALEEEEVEGEVNDVPLDFRAGSLFRGAGADDDRLVDYYDVRMGLVKVPKSQAERMAREASTPKGVDPMIQAQLDSLKDFTKTLAENMNRLIEKISEKPKDDFASKWLEMERERETRRAEKAEGDAKEAKQRADDDRKEAEKQRRHEAELLEKKLEAQEARMVAEKTALEARADADRRYAQERSDKAQELVMSLMNQKTSPTDNITSVLGLMRDFRDVFDVHPASVEDPTEKKALVERAFEKFVAGVQAAYPTMEPFLKQKLREMMFPDQPAAQLPAPPPSPAPTHRPTPRPVQQAPKPTPRPAPAAPATAPAPQTPTIDMPKMILTLLDTVNKDIDRNFPPKMSLQGIREEFPMLAMLLADYETPEQLAEGISELSKEEALAAHAPAMQALAARITGAGRTWAVGFVNAAKARA